MRALAQDKLWTPAEMTEKYFPLEKDYAAVSAWLTQHNFTITRTDPNRMGIWASGTVEQVTNALKTSFVKVTSNGRAFTSAQSAPSLPASVAAAVVGVNGLQPHLQKHVHSRFKTVGSRANNQAPFYPSEI